MEVFNKRTICNVKNSDSNLKLDGEAQVDESKKVTTFMGTFYTPEDEYAGTFTYSEREGDVVDKSVNSFPTNLQNKGIELLDATVVELKSTL